MILEGFLQGFCEGPLPESGRVLKGLWEDVKAFWKVVLRIMERYSKGV